MSSHLLIVGQTASGKTTLLRRLALMARAQGRPILAATSPAADPGQWSWASGLFTAPESLTAALKKFSGAFVALDEAGTILGHGSKDLEAAILTARHRGHTIAISTQRAALVSRTCRDQCGRVYAFRVGIDDAKDLAAQYGYKELIEAAKLPKGKFLTATPWEGPRLGKMF